MKHLEDEVKKTKTKKKNSIYLIFFPHWIQHKKHTYLHIHVNLMKEKTLGKKYLGQFYPRKKIYHQIKNSYQTLSIKRKNSVYILILFILSVFEVL